MNARLLVLIALPTVLLAAGTDELPVSAKTRGLLKSGYRFDPTISEQAPVEPGDDVLELPVLTVTESMRRRDLEHAVDESEQRLEAKKYSIVRGGTIYEKEFPHAKIELGTWPAGPGIAFLRISW